MNIRQVIFEFATLPLTEEMFESPLTRALQEASVRSELSLNAAHSSHFSDFLRSVFIGQPANPSKKDVIERFRATYSSAAFGEINTKKEIEYLLTEKDNVALVANRGLGKTAWVNNWLHESTRTFIEDELNYNWFRIDVGKLYNLRQNGKINHDDFTMSDYFKLHTAYVFLEYSGHIHNKLSRIPTELSPKLVSILKSITSNSDGAIGKFNEDSDVIDDFYKKIKLNKYNKNHPSEVTIEEISKLPKSTGPRAAFERIYNLVCEHSSKRGIGILAIIDGIDNVSWKPRSNQYSKMCKEAREFILEFHGTALSNHRKILLVARPETIPEIDIRHGSMPTDPIPSIAFDMVSLPPPNPSDVLKCKLIAARSSEAFSVQRYRCQQRLEDEERKKGAGIRAFEDEHQRHMHRQPEFLSSMWSEVRTILSKTKPPSDESLFISHFDENANPLIMFDQNVRAVLNGFLRSLEGKMHAREVGASVEGVRMTEYILLGGKLFVDSAPRMRGAARYDDIPEGEVFPNIFWYDGANATESGARWQGLAGLRLLQLAFAAPNVAGDLLYILHECFGYSTEVLIEHLEAFVAFGLIDIIYEGRPGKPALSGNSEFIAHRSIIKTSDKGRILSTLALNWVDWMYFLAIDTPMHRYFVPTPYGSRGEKYMRLYRRPNLPTKANYNYVDAMIPTVTTFMRVIFHWHQSELNRLQKLTQSGDSNLFREVVSYRTLTKAFEFSDDWVDGCARQLSSRWYSRKQTAHQTEKDTSEIDQFELDFVGTFRS